MKKPWSVKISPQGIVDRTREREAPVAPAWPVAPEEKEAVVRFDPELLVTLRAEIADAHRKFDAILHWLGYRETQPIGDHPIWRHRLENRLQIG